MDECSATLKREADEEASKSLETLAAQLVCRHAHTCGGNDFVECRDCGLEWDYSKRTPLMMLRAANHKLFK